MGGSPCNNPNTGGHSKNDTNTRGSYSNSSNTRGDRSSSRHMQNFSQEGTNNFTYTDPTILPSNFTYPDPTILATQAFPSRGSRSNQTFPLHNQHVQPFAPNANATQPGDYLVPDFMRQSVPDMRSFGMEQIGRGNQHNATSFRSTNMATHTTNMAVSYNINTQAHPSTSATQNIYSPGYPFGYASGNIYHTNRPNPYQATTPGVAPGLCYIAPQVATISANTKSSTESARRNPSRKRKEHPRDVTGLETWRLPGLNENPRRTQQPAERARRLARKRTANTHPGQQPAENTANTPAVGQGRQSSKRGQAKAKLGDNLGFDRRPRAPIKEIGGVLWGLVNDEWKRAGYHRDFRRRLILKASQQPGAPVWEEGMSLDYTSFSPLTHGWTNEHDVKDSKGRKVFLMSEPPTDLEPNPKLGYMRFEDLYMLDDNNRPIIDYPGVPATLSTQAPPLLMEGLRRVTEMSIFDEMSRMVRERETPSGMRPRQGSTAFSNRIQRFLDNPENKAKGICPWFERAKGNATGEGIAENSEWSDEEADATKPTPEYLDPDQATVASLRNSFSRYPALASRPPAAMSLLRNFTPLAAEAASFSEHQLRRTDPRMPLPEPEVFSNGPIVARNIENRFGWAQAFTPMPSLDMDLNTDTYPTGFWSAAAGTSTTMVTPTDATPPEFDPLTVDWNDPSWDTGPHFRGSKPGSTP